MSDDARRADGLPRADHDGAAEREVDRLVQLAARGEMLREDSAFYTDDRLVAWLDRELSAPEHAKGGWSERRIGQAAERMRARAAASRLRVATPDGAAPRRAAAVRGTVPQVVGEARRLGYAPAVSLAAAAGAGRELWDEPCDEWVELPRDTPPGQYVALKVSGDSMAPLLRTDDVILVRLGPKVERDTVVVARLPEGGYVVKRVGQIGRTRLVLTSLNAAVPPLTVPRAAGAVVGTVVMRWSEGAHRPDA